MKRYFVQYHKAEELGLPNHRPEFNVDNKGFRDGLKFFTKKRPPINEYCFLIVGISGIGKRKEFYLWNLIKIENVNFDGEFYRAEGSGIEFRNPILLNNLPRFQELKTRVANFSLGFTDITNLEFCNDLIGILDEYESYLLVQALYDDNLDKVNKARKLSSEEREKIIAMSSDKPDKKLVTITVYNRNPVVIAEALERSNGICGKCFQKAPFTRDKDGSEYLEVHHKIPLSENGDDTLENTIALCPNCHRHAHYGKATYNDR